MYVEPDAIERNLVDSGVGCQMETGTGGRS